MLGLVRRTRWVKKKQLGTSKSWLMENGHPYATLQDIYMLYTVVCLPRMDKCFLWRFLEEGPNGFKW